MNTIVAYTDYVCPFCYLSKIRLKRERPVLSERLEWRGFELRPLPVPTLRPEDPYLPEIWRQSVYPMANALGVEIRLPTVSPQPRTELAFMGRFVAEDADVADAYDTAMYEAFFVEDRNIGDIGVIADVGQSVGLSHAKMLEIPTTEALGQRHLAVQNAARQLDVNGVPSFFKDGRRVSEDMLSD